MESKPPALPVTFRPMTLEDIPFVREIDVRSFAMPWSERSYRFEISENMNSLSLVAEAVPAGALLGRPVIVGMSVIWVIIDEAHIATIATHPDYRGMSVGRRLLAHGLLEAYERGARLAYLEVRRGNTVAQNLYRQFGFQIVGERPRYYQDNFEDALLMTLENIQPETLQRFTI